MIYDNVFNLIGNTPLLKLKEDKNNNKVYLKLEKYNPSGSVKDRASFYMLNKAKERGLINENTTIIEPTSGNTGIGLAYFGNIFKLKVIIVMPSSMSLERRKLITDYGAELELVDGNMSDCINRAINLSKKIKNSFIPSQFSNSDNPLAHYETTGPEIYKDVPNITTFISGIGTGGTISGVAKFLKEKNKDIEIIGVEPIQSPIISQNKSGKHKIQGIGAGFIPENLDLSLINKIIMVDENDSINKAKEILKEEGLFVGISSGAALQALDIYCKDNSNKNIVVLLPDGGERYTWN